jgi:type IV secretion system protein VirB1
MEASLFVALATACAPGVHVDTAGAVVQVESGFNPWAIGVVGGQLLRQPKTRAEALATAHALQRQGWNFSVGLGQISARNFAWLGLNVESAFEPCTNLAAMQTVLSECFRRANADRQVLLQTALRRALSCYYSGDFGTGFLHGYVSKVVSAATRANSPSPATLKEKT